MKDLRETQGTMAFLQPSQTLAITAKADALKAAGENVCAMGAGQPDFDTPEHIKEAAVKALTDGKTKYTPSSGIMELRKAIVDKLEADNGIKCETAQVIVSPGAKFSGFAAIAALCGPGDEVIIPAPYWLSYPEMVKAAGATSVILKTKAENNFEVDLAELEATITPRTKLLILNTPSNPTGAVYSRKTIEGIAALALKYNFMVMSDEIYEKLVYDAEYPHCSIASLSPEMAEQTITINGFSKAYSMPGWRLGYLTAPMWLAKRIAAFQSHTTSNPTSFAQYGAVAALTGPQEPVEEMRKAFAARRDLVYDLVSAIPGIKTIRPQGAFYLFFNVSSFGLGATDFVTRLLDEKKVAAVPGDAFGDSESVRISYACSDAVIREACSRMAEFCAGLK